MPRRALRTGLPVFRSDLIEPFQVQRGDLVDVTAISEPLKCICRRSPRRRDDKAT